MRLDHLLSKEQLTGREHPVGAGPCQDERRRPSSGSARVAWMVLEGGTLTSSEVRPWPARQYCRGSFGDRVWSAGRRGRGFVGTLLGPGGAGSAGPVRAAGASSGAGPVRLSYRPEGFPGSGGGVRAGGCLLVENCTVDASIFSDPAVFGLVGSGLSSGLLCVG